MWCLLHLALTSPLARAEDPSLDRLPEVIAAVSPTYPPEALAAGLSANVLLQLELRDDGSIDSVSVIESAGPAFDAAAVQAIRSFRFSPALDDRGAPVPATLQYRMVFEPTRAPPISVEGEVRTAGTRERLANIDVVVSREGERLVATTDAEGRFRLAGLSTGTWLVEAKIRGYRIDPFEVTVEDGKVADVVVYAEVDREWEVARDGISEEVTVVGRRVAPEVTERVLSREEVRYLPGTAGDVVRVVQNLPGVARPPLGIGQLIIRGTAPEDSAYYLDGAPIPNVFHFAGFSTVLNSDSIGEIALISGNYGARYGRTIGGVVDLRVEDQLPERSRGYVSVDLFQTTVFTEQKFRRSAITLSGRRSYVDAVLNPILNGSSGSSIRAPRYYDLQARWTGQTRSGGTLDTLFLLSDDAFRVVGEDDAVTIGLSTSFQKIRFLSREPLPNGWRNELSVIAGPEVQEFLFAGAGIAYERPFTIAAREELVAPPPGDGLGLGWRVGADVAAGRFNYLYDIPDFGAEEGADLFRFLPAVYAEPTIRLGPVQLTPGLRADWALVGTWTALALDPRLAVRAEVTDQTTLEATAGGYSQFPTVRQVVDAPDLGPIRSWQFSAGIEQQFGTRWQLELTGFNNWLDNLISGREDAFRFFTGPPPVGPLDTGPYANDGTGQIYGVEGLLRYSTRRSAAWLSATFSRSTRIDRPGNDQELFEYDQPIVLTALGTHELPRRWRLGARFRYSSGNPYTPVVNRVYDLDTRAWLPVYGAEEDGERLPAFYTLDVRVDKDWVYRNWTLTLYVDVQNATNRTNVEVPGWNEDYSQEEPIAGLPLVPAFGVRGEW